MEVNNEQKVEILLSALEERYQSLRTIRNRVQNTGVWALGIMIGIGGWLLQDNSVLSLLQKELYILAIIIAFVVIRFFYLKDLNIGFKGQQRIAAKLEKALGLFTPGFFDGSEKTMYKESWEKAGTEKGEGGFFRTTYIFIYVGVIFLVSVILLKGSVVQSTSFDISTIQVDLAKGWFGKLIDLLVVFLGVFLAFWLNEISNGYTKKKVYENLRDALKMEFDSNAKLIREERGVGVSFDTFKMVISNEIFINNILKDERFKKGFITDLWNVMSELREVKGFNGFKNYMAGVEFTNPGYKKFNEVHNKLKS